MLEHRFEKKIIIKKGDLVLTEDCIHVHVQDEKCITGWGLSCTCTHDWATVLTSSKLVNLFCFCDVFMQLNVGCD